MCDAFPGWALIIYLPEGGNGLMRSWHSESVQRDDPELPGAVRDLVFAELAEHRVQRLKEEQKKREREAMLAKAQKEDDEAKIRDLLSTNAEMEVLLEKHGIKRKRASSDAFEAESGSVAR